MKENRLIKSFCSEKKRKKKRRVEQEKNVDKKHKAVKFSKNEDGEADDEADEVEDSEYYRQEVGEEPEPELFSRSKKSKGSSQGGKKTFDPWWKNKKNDSDKPKKEGGKKAGNRKFDDSKETKNPKKKLKK